MSVVIPFGDLNAVATHLRDALTNGLPQKKDNPNRLIDYVLLFAYNGTGKTRLSMEFKGIGKKRADALLTLNGDIMTVNDHDFSVEYIERDTLYFNAYTEDLFNWDNDLENDARSVLRLNRDSRFFAGLQELEMESRIGSLLARYADFNFFIDYAEWEISFFRDRDANGDPIPIKVSRGEENIFVWCFFLAVAQLAVDGQEAYAWVKYIYADDPISSLDDNNAIAVAAHLANLLKEANGKIKAVISTHHALFFNVLWNSLNEKGKNNPLQPYFLNSNKATGGYALRYTNETPFIHHVALLKQLHEAVEADQLYTYHFNILRSILEKTATFHGFPNFSACIKQDADDEDGVLHARLINVLSHGNYSLFEPREMLEENKQYFKKILNDFMENYRFNPELFPELNEEAPA